MKRSIFLLCIFLAGCVPQTPTASIQQIAQGNANYMCSTKGLKPGTKKFDACVDKKMPLAFQMAAAEQQRRDMIKMQRQAAVQNAINNMEANNRMNYQMQMQNLQNQQMMHQMNRPVQTSCQRMGAFVNCTSY